MAKGFVLRAHRNFSCAIKGAGARLWSAIALAGLILAIAGGISAPLLPNARAEAQAALPNGSYNALLRYGGRIGRCSPFDESVQVRVHNSSIAFEDGFYRWEGTINQITGYIDIPRERIANLTTNEINRPGFSIRGSYRQALVVSEFCGRGVFVISPNASPQ